MTPRTVDGPEIKLVLGISVLLAGVLYFLSITQDCFFCSSPGTKEPYALSPFRIVIMGWGSVSPRMPAWLANPAMLASIAFLKDRDDRNVGVAFAWLSLAFALSFLLNINQNIMTDGNIGSGRIVGIGPGYGLWVGSIATNALGGSIAYALTFNKKSR